MNERSPGTLISGEEPRTRADRCLPASAGLGRLGLQKTTLLDFPGEVAATVFTRGCNLRCPYCHNPELVEPPPAPSPSPASPAPSASPGHQNRGILTGNEDPGDGMISIEEFDQFLSRRAKLLGGVCITGGEPLMHENTDELARLIRSHDLKVKLDSNGTYPERLEGLLSSGLLDYVAMDLKTAPGLYGRLLSGTSPGRTRTELRIGRTGHDDLLASTHTGDLLRAGEELGERIRRSVEVLRRWTVPYELRTTVAPGIVCPEEMEEIAPLLPGARRYVLKAFRGGTTLDPEWSNVESPSDELMNRLCKLAAASGVPCEIS